MRFAPVRELIPRHPVGPVYGDLLALARVFSSDGVNARVYFGVLGLVRRWDRGTEV